MVLGREVGDRAIETQDVLFKERTEGKIGQGKRKRKKGTECLL